MRERKRRHDDTHWPYFSGCRRTPRAERIKDVKFKNPMWILTEEDGKAYRLGRFETEESARKMAKMFGHSENFNLAKDTE